METNTSFKQLKGPKGLPFIGNTFDVDPKKFHLDIVSLSQQYGGTFKMSILGRDTLVISDHQAIRDVLKRRPKSFKRSTSVSDVVEELIGPGLFTAVNPAWHKMRRLVMAGFTPRKLKLFYPNMLTIVDRLEALFHKRAAENKLYEIQKDFMGFTIDVTTNFAFGYDAKTLLNNDDELRKHLKHVFPKLSQRFQLPVSYWRYFKLKSDRDLDRHIEAVKTFVEGYIEKSKQGLKDKDQQQKSYNTMETLILEAEKEDLTITNEELIGNVLTILLAGEDTTANSLAWVVYFLVQHPKVLDKMRQECERVFSGQKRHPSYEEQEDLKYIEAVIKETIRLRPVSPMLISEALEDTTVAGIPIRKGTQIFNLFYHNYLSEKSFTKASQFIPERWLEPRPEELTNHDELALLPFGYGPRICPGSYLALLEMKAVLAMLAQKFTIGSSCELSQVENRFDFTTYPKGLEVSLKALEP